MIPNKTAEMNCGCNMNRTKNADTSLSSNNSATGTQTLRNQASGARTSGIYIHIPFCIRKCNYCAFLSSPSSEEQRDAYVDALIREIHLRRGEVPLADSVYFGGGTPSLLMPSQIYRILDAIKTNYITTDTAEVTLEANPATLTAESLWGYRSVGVNRLSIGVQSMDNRRLRFLGRLHTAEDVYRDYRLARNARFENINLDLMFGIPGMTLSDAMMDLRKIASLEPEHISFYSLQLEEDTPFFQQFEAGELSEVPDEMDREMYHRGNEFLKERGYEHYEISNFCKPGYRSIHNSKYWNLSEYVGLGLGASSYTNHTRILNETELEVYCRKMERGELPQADVHENSEFDDVSEAVFTGLRRYEGIRYDEVTGSKSRFYEIYSGITEELEKFRLSGDLEITDDGIRLTENGIDISNRIMALFV